MTDKEQLVIPASTKWARVRGRDATRIATIRAALFVFFDEATERRAANASSLRFHARVEQMRPHGRPLCKFIAGAKRTQKNRARKLGKR